LSMSLAGDLAGLDIVSPAAHQQSVVEELRTRFNESRREQPVVEQAQPSIWSRIWNRVPSMPNIRQPFARLWHRQHAERPQMNQSAEQLAESSAAEGQEARHEQVRPSICSRAWNRMPNMSGRTANLWNRMPDVRGRLAALWNRVPAVRQPIMDRMQAARNRVNAVNRARAFYNFVTNPRTKAAVYGFITGVALPCAGYGLYKAYNLLRG